MSIIQSIVIISETTNVDIVTGLMWTDFTGRQTFAQYCILTTCSLWLQPGLEDSLNFKIQKICKNWFWHWSMLKILSYNLSFFTTLWFSHFPNHFQAWKKHLYQTPWLFQVFHNRKKLLKTSLYSAGVYHCSIAAESQVLF